MNEPTFEKHGSMAVITFNRPDKLNAMNVAAYAGTEAALKEFIADDSLHCAVFRGNGRAFTAGGDLDGYAAKPLEEWHTVGLPTEVLSLNHTLWNCPKPLIAAVHGACMGWGMVVVEGSDIRLASRSAKLSYAGGTSVFAGWGAYFAERLVLQVPFTVAMKILLTNPTLTADEAFQYGLVTEVVESDDQLMATAEKYAALMGKMPPGALKVLKGATRRVLNHATIPAQETTTQEALRYIKGEDFVESLRAWKEKRAPVWTGR